MPTPLALACGEVGVWEWDFARPLLRVDARWCADMQLDSCPGADHVERWMRQIHPDDVAEFRRKYEALRAGAGRFEVEYRMLRADLRWVWVLQRGRIIERDAQGRAQRVCGVCIEMDDRKKAQLTLKENESRLVTALWGARAAFWQWHVSATDATVQSPLWFAMTGYTRAQWESLPQPWLARIHPQDRMEVERQIHEHVHGRLPAIDIEYRIHTADAQWKWMLTRGRAVEWDFEGHATCCIGVCLDVDAHKRTERALRRLEVALTVADGGVWDWNLSTGELQGREAWRRVLALDPGTGPQRSPLWTARIHPQDLPRAQEALRRVIEEGQDAFEARYRLKHADGSWRWVLDRGRICERHEDGTAARMVGFLSDITERAQAQGLQRRYALRRQALATCARGFSFEYRFEGEDALVLADVSEEAAPGAERSSGGLLALLEEEATPLRALLERVRTGESVSSELCIRTPAGPRWLKTGMVPVRDEHTLKVVGVVGAAHDITSLKRTEQALRESEGLLRAVTESHPDWLLLLDTELRLQYINRGFGRYAVEDLIGRHVLALAPADNRDEMIRLHHQVLSTGEPVSFDFHFQRKERRLCYAHRLVPVRQDGEIRFLAVTIADVTERRRTENRQRESRRLLETLVENSADWLALFDRQLRCIFLNHPLRGVAAESWIGAPVEDFAPPTPEDRTRVREIFQELQRTGEPQDFELMLRSEPQRWVAVSARAVKDEGAVGTCVVNIRDISGQRARRELWQSQAHILHALHEGVLLWEPGSGLVTFANPAFERLINAAPGTLVGQHIGPLLSFAAGHCEPLARALEGALPEDSEPVELVGPRAGSTLPVAMGMLKTVQVGERPHLLLLARDVSEHRSLEREIVEIANREQQRIGGDIHDELGQDLTAAALRLRGAVVQLRQEGSPVRLDVEEAIERVNHAIESMRSIARGLLPVGAGNGLLASIQALATRVSERHGISVALEGPDVEPLRVKACAATQVYRIVQEALTNVIRHSRATEVCIRLRRHPGTGSALQRLQVCVQDNGRGLPPGAREGGGLGLKVMRHRARMLDAQLSVESDATGTRVRFSCPLDPPDAA